MSPPHGSTGLEIFNSAHILQYSTGNIPIGVKEASLHMGCQALSVNSNICAQNRNPGRSTPPYRGAHDAHHARDAHHAHGGPYDAHDAHGAHDVHAAHDDTHMIMRIEKMMR